MRALYNAFFSRFGLPRQLHSEQRRNFESRLVAELCKITGVYKTRTTPFHPRSDGQTERANRTILQMLRTTAEDNPADWSNRLPAILAAYRMTPHSSTGVSPNKVMLGREVLLSCTLIGAPPEADPLPPHLCSHSAIRCEKHTILSAKTCAPPPGRKSSTLTLESAHIPST